MKWTPDGAAVAMSWTNGGFSLWSTFGATLMCSLGWDYGLNVDLVRNNPLNIMSMDWSIEGYQLVMVRHQFDTVANGGLTTSIVVLQLVKSSLTSNPCMVRESSVRTLELLNEFYSHTLSSFQSSHPHLLLQSDNKLYLNQGDSVRNIRYNSKLFSQAADLDGSPAANESPLYSGYAKNSNVFSTSYNICTASYINGDVKRVPPGDEQSVYQNHRMSTGTDFQLGTSLQVTSILSENKNWLVVQIPASYLASNWPIRYSANDRSGANVAVAGKYGFALYATGSRKWKLFGNETQEKDFVVTGGLVWWHEFVILACYSMTEERDELRMYPKDTKLDDKYAKIIPMGAPVLLLNLLKDQLVVFTGDGFVTSFAIVQHDKESIDLLKVSVYDIRSLCIHPACIVSVAMTNLKNETIPRAAAGQGEWQSLHCTQQGLINNPCCSVIAGQPLSETLVLNVSGRLLMVQQEASGTAQAHLVSQKSSCLFTLLLARSLL